MRAVQRLGTKGTRRPRVSYGQFISRSRQQEGDRKRRRELTCRIEEGWGEAAVGGAGVADAMQDAQI